MGPETDTPLDFDLMQMEGVAKYVEHVKEEVQRLIFHTKTLPPLGSLFATCTLDKARLNKPEPFSVGHLGTRKALEKLMRKSCLDLNAVGAILIHAEGRRVIFQMEHRTLGDLVWYATLDQSAFMGKLYGPTKLEKFEFKKLTMLPERYMS